MSRINILSVSGGKDSTAMYLDALEHGVEFRAVFADTGNEHELTLEYVRELPIRTGGPEIQWIKADFSAEIERKRGFVQSKWPHLLAANDNAPSKEEIDRKIERALAVLHPTGNPFLDLAIWKGRFPSTKARFCTSELKVVPIFEQVIEPALQEAEEVYSWQVVRREESQARAKLEPLEHKGGGLWDWRPILDWTISDVWEIHKRHGLEPNPLYLQGMGRVGCMPCIMCRKNELHEIARRFPEHIVKIREWEAVLRSASKRGISTFFPAPTVPGEGDARANIDEAVRWAATSRGGRQFDLVKSIDPTPCSSEYGLCE